MNYKIIDIYVGNEIKVKRKEQKISVRAMAEYLGISRASYSFYENADRSMPTNIYVKCCDKLQIDYIDLFERAQMAYLENMKKEFGE